jgi:hypothetical protein
MIVLQCGFKFFTYTVTRLGMSKYVAARTPRSTGGERELMCFTSEAAASQWVIDSRLADEQSTIQIQESIRRRKNG